METPRNSSSSLRRALDLLEVIAGQHAGGGYTLTGLAEQAGLSKSTALRLLAPLIEYGYVETDASSGKYRLGAGLARLGTSYIEGLDLRSVASPFLQDLSEESGETVHLLVPNGTSMVYVDKVEAPQPMQMASRVGAHVPMYCTASGAAYLSLAGAEAFEAVVAAGMPPRTPATPETPQQLQSAIDHAVARGYAVDDMANEDHIRGIAAAVVDASSRPVAVLSIVGPDFSLTPARFELLGSLAVATARRISARLGARPSFPHKQGIQSVARKERIL